MIVRLALMFLLFITQPLQSQVQPGSEKDLLSAAIEGLSDSNPKVRMSSVTKLGALGRIGIANGAVPVLARALRDPDALVRWSAVSALESFGESAKDAGPALIQALQDPRLRRGVPMTLGKIGPAAKEAVPALLQALNDPDAVVRVNSARAIIDIETTASPALRTVESTMVQMIRAQEGPERVSAVAMLGQIGTLTKVGLPALLQALRDHDPGVRRAAVSAVKEIGPGAKNAVPLPLKLAARGQSSFSPPNPGLDSEQGAEEFFRREMQFEDSLRAVEILGEIGPAAKDAVPTLESLVDNRMIPMRILSAAALAKIAPAGSPSFNKAVDTLIKITGVRASSEEEAEALELAVKALAKINLPAGRAIPVWIQFLRYNDLHPEVTEAFGKIGVQAIPILLKALADPATRKNAAIAIGEVGPAAKDAIPALAEIMNGADPSSDEHEMRGEIVKTLGKLGSSAVPALISIQKRNRYNYFHEAGGALRRMGSAGVPEFIHLLRDPDPLYRAEAAELLGSIRPASVDAVAALAVAMDDPDLQVRNQAVTSLGELGPESKSAVPALNRALWNGHRLDVDSVLRALRKIGPAAAVVLAQGLKHRKSAARVLASDALVELGPVAVWPTVQILSDPNEGIQLLAESVLLRMGSGATPELEKAAVEIPELRSRIEKILREIRKMEATAAKSRGA